MNTMKKWAVLSILILTFFGCNKVQESNLNTTMKADSVEIMDILRRDYSTLSTWDFNLHSSLITDNYLLIENGEILTIEDDKTYFNKNRHRDLVRKNYFDIVLMDIDENNAYLVYKLKSDYFEKDTSVTKNWTESAVFKKVDGEWKIALINSTPHH